MFKKFALAALIVALPASLIHAAAATGSLTHSFTVAPVNTMTYTDASPSFTDPLTGANANVAVGTILINNNNPAGFSVTITSGFAGQFRHTSEYGAGRPGSFIAYTVNLVSGSGSLGAPAPTLPSATALTTAWVGNFGAATEGTVDKVYTLQVNMAQKQTIFRGSFNDLITIDVADL